MHTENDVPNWKPYSFLVSGYKCLVRTSNAAVSCVNHHERFMQYWASPSEEEERREKNILPIVRGLVACYSRFLAQLGVLLVKITLEGERYMHCQWLRIVRFFWFYHILRVHAILAYRVYRLYDMHGVSSCQCVIGSCLSVCWEWMQGNLLFRQEHIQVIWSLRQNECVLTFLACTRHTDEIKTIHLLHKVSATLQCKFGNNEI